jgi:ion channel-forming bestrophin family protein
VLRRVMGIATAVCIEHALARNGVIPAALELRTLNMAPVNLTSFALSLLLVFRTNSSYGRFDEARKFWGLALNRSRDLARQAVAYFPSDSGANSEAAQRTATFARWVAVWMVVFKCHVRPKEDLRREAAELLTAEELELLMASDHKARCRRPLWHGSEHACVLEGRSGRSLVFWRDTCS